MVNAAIWFTFGLPLLLTTCGRLSMQLESVWAQLLLCWAYHVMRIGPFFMNFAYVYTLCHKEGHAAAAGHGLWRPPFDRRGPFRYLFNWWVGLYYGVMPATFAIGHSINHHKYNNGPADVVSTADKPRDEWVALVAYVPRFLLYACNVSTTYQFLREGKWDVAISTVIGTLYYVAFAVLVAQFYGGIFAFAYLAYPFFEQCLMLSGINWVWHAFLDPDDVENEYVASITILGGTINVLNEDSHVVHHQYPGFHWSKHPKLLLKHEVRRALSRATSFRPHAHKCSPCLNLQEGYRKSIGSVFYGTHTFELLALILLADYDKLADRFVGHLPPNTEDELFGCGTHDKTAVERPKCPVTHEEAVELIKTRLRTCWWGPRAKQISEAELASGGEKFARLAEWEMVDDDDVMQGAEDAPDSAEAPAAAPTKTPRTDEILLSSSDKENGVRQRTGRQVDSPVSDE